MTIPSKIRNFRHPPSLVELEGRLPPGTLLALVTQVLALVIATGKN